MPKYTKADISNFFDEIKEYNYLCKGCGVCVGACPTDSLSMISNKYAEQLAVFDETECISCGKCTIICPGKDIFPLKDKSPIGKNLGIYLAFSNSLDQRQAGSSGGVISALSSYAIENGLADKTIMLNSSDSPTQPIPFHAKNRDDISKCASSKYVYYPIGDQIKYLQKDTIITTLPCQASGIRKTTKKGIVFGLFCSKAATKELVHYVAKKEAIPLAEITAINYRSGNWPGYVSLKTDKTEVKIPYNRSYYTASFNSSLFSPQACLFCNDYMSDKADISFGDPWSKHLNKELKDTPGHSLVIVRTERGNELFQKAIDDGVITVSEISEEIVIEGHLSGIFSKRSGLQKRIDWLKKHNMPVPNYSKEDIIPASYQSLIWEKFYIYNSFFFKQKGYYKIISLYPKWYMFFRRFSVASFQRYFVKKSNYLHKIMKSNG